MDAKNSAPNGAPRVIGPVFKANVTIAEKYGPAMEITDQAEANRYFERCVQHTMGFGKTRVQAEIIERRNLGYYAGYFSQETFMRVCKLFNTSHPIFGSRWPSPEEAFELGKMWAKGELG